MRFTFDIIDPAFYAEQLREAAALPVLAPPSTFYGRAVCAELADQIEAQLPAPRIEEPGYWGVVVSTYDPVYGKSNYVHHIDGYWRGASGSAVRWHELIDPLLVREGVPS